MKLEGPLQSIKYKWGDVELCSLQRCCSVGITASVHKVVLKTPNSGTWTTVWWLPRWRKLEDGLEEINVDGWRLDLEWWTHNTMYRWYVIELYTCVLGGVAQWIESQPFNQRITGLIPSQGTCLGFRPGLWLGVCERQLVSLTHQCFSTSSSLNK